MDQSPSKSSNESIETSWVPASFHRMYPFTVPCSKPCSSKNTILLLRYFACDVLPLSIIEKSQSKILNWDAGEFDKEDNILLPNLAQLNKIDAYSNEIECSCYQNSHQMLFYLLMQLKIGILICFMKLLFRILLLFHTLMQSMRRICWSSGVDQILWRNKYWNHPNKPNLQPFLRNQKNNAKFLYLSRYLYELKWRI